MFNNIAFDVVIGLIFVYLLYSLLATILQEILAHIMNLRSRMLGKALRRMLQDDVVEDHPTWTKIKFLTFFYSLFGSLYRFFVPNKKDEELIALFYEQPSIKYLGESRHSSKPSYLQPHNFSTTVTQLLRGPEYNGSDNNEAALIKTTLQSRQVSIAPNLKLKTHTSSTTVRIPDETWIQLNTLFADAHQDPILFRRKLEGWFEETMERASGWYKKQTQVILFLIGLGIAINFNVDTISIYRILAKDKDARQQIVNMAIHKADDLHGYVNTAKSAEDQNDTALYKTYHKVSDEIDQANKILGMGVSKPAGFVSAIGMLLTALAISLGSPFWFDLLNKFINLRGSGPKPETAAAGSASGGNSKTNMPPSTSDGTPIRG